MNRIELRKILDKRNVPEAIYSLDGRKGGERLCITNEENTWKVIYDNWGKITYSAICSNEEEACEVFFKMTKDAYGWEG